jgi:hypothetical protein
MKNTVATALLNLEQFVEERMRKRKTASASLKTRLCCRIITHCKGSGQDS